MTTEALTQPQSTPQRKAATPADLLRCAERVQRIVESLGLSTTQLIQLLGKPTTGQLEALDALLGKRRSASRAATHKVLVALEDRLGMDLGSRELRGSLERIGQPIASVFGAVLGLGCCYIVVGGLLLGESLMLGEGAGPLGLLLFFGILAVLATFEALHVSAAMLKIADLGAIAEKHPRAASLHRRFHTDEGLARFLAGRQLVVVATVFLCSSLSSFPDMTHLPFTNVAVPAVLHPLLAIGMPGALFVLWFGQLAPQFIATRRAVQLTDTRIAGLAFQLAYGLEAAGLARLGFWASAWDKATEKIPFSAALRWKQSAEEVDGVGVVGLVRDWSVSEDELQLHATSTLRVYESGISAITDGSMLVPAAPGELHLEADGASTTGKILTLAPTDHREETLSAGGRRFHKPLESAIGSFEPGDTLRVRLEAKYSSPVWQDVVQVDRPVRFVSFLVTPRGVPRMMPAATLRTFGIGDGIDDLTELSAESIEPKENANGVPVLDHVIDFPPPNTLFVLDWEVVM